jgi:hypothetical protein
MTITPTLTITPTITPTLTITPTITPTFTHTPTLQITSDCSCHSVGVHIDDLNDSDNGTLYLDVIECDGRPATRSFVEPGTYSICVQSALGALYYINNGFTSMAMMSYVTYVGGSCINDNDCLT